MTSFERQQRLLGLLRTEPGLRVPEMAERLCVSDGTIRNDLAALRNLRVVTNCLETAQLLAQNPTHSVMLVGGILRAGMVSVIGPWSEQFLSELCTRLAFVSCSGFTPEGGMTEVDVFEAQFRLKAIQCAGQVIGLADSTKFGKVDLTQSLRPEQIDHLYTDSKLEVEWQERLVKAGIPFTLCNVKNNL